MTIQFIDVYSPNTMPSNWTSLPAVIHKATQGTFNQQAMYAPRRTQYGNNGVWGAYHVYMGNSAGGGVAQARYFISFANPKPGDVVALDFEQFDGSFAGKSHQWLADDAAAWLRECRRLRPKNRILLYCNRSDWHAICSLIPKALYDGLWIATLDNNQNPAGIPWLVVQYAVKNNVDWNIAKFANEAAMVAWANYGGVTDDDKEDIVSSEAGVMTLPDGTSVVVVVGTDGYLYRSLDEGASFAKIEGDPKLKYLPGCSVSHQGAYGAWVSVRWPNQNAHVIDVPNIRMPADSIDWLVGRSQIDRFVATLGITTVGEDDLLLVGVGTDQHVYTAKRTAGVWSVWAKRGGTAL